MTPTYAGQGRHSDQCIACGSDHLAHHWNVTSRFFAERALLSRPEIVALLECHTCKTKYFDLVVSDEQLGRLYAGYRGDVYFKQRHRYEPWYTRAINEGIGGETEMSKRRVALTDALTDAGITRPLESVLDHGGDRGQMMQDLPARLKAVFEISGVPTDDGVQAISEDDMHHTKWDLILSCHVLEHLTFPSSYVKNLVSLGATGTVYFIEIPDELFRIFRFNPTGSSVQKRWLSFVLRRPLMLIILDFLSTATRLKLRILPPFFFVTLREHLTFFSIAGISKLLENNGLKVLSARVISSGHIGVVAVKP